MGGTRIEIPMVQISFKPRGREMPHIIEGLTNENKATVVTV